MQSAGCRPNRREKSSGEANWTRQALSAARTRSPPFSYPPFPALSRPSWFAVDATLHGSGAPLFLGPSLFFFSCPGRAEGRQTFGCESLVNPVIKPRTQVPPLFCLVSCSFTLAMHDLTPSLAWHGHGHGHGMAWQNFAGARPPGGTLCGSARGWIPHETPSRKADPDGGHRAGDVGLSGDDDASASAPAAPLWAASPSSSSELDQQQPQLLTGAG